MPKIKQLKEKKGDYKIYGVRKEEDFIKIDRELAPPYDSFFASNGSVVGIFASPSSGKSNLISNWILRDEYFKDLFTNGVYVVSPTILQDLSSVHLKEYADFVETEYSEQLIREIMDNIYGGSDPTDDDEERGMSCVILDDILGLIKPVNSVTNKLCSQVRHLRSLVILSLQAVKGIPATVRSCLSVTVIFHTASKKQFNDIVELHSMMGGEDNFIRCYEEATNVKYGFLVCDWRKMRMFKHGGDTNDPELLWRMYNDEGKRIKYDKVDENEKPIERTCI